MRVAADAQSIDPLPEGGFVLRKNAKGDEGQRLGCAVGQDLHPAVRVAVGVQVNVLVMLLHVHAESGVKSHRRGDVGHGKHHLVNRMRGQHIGSAGRI